MWLQDKVNRGELELHKVKGTENMSDALTKYVTGAETRDHIAWSGMESRGGRHELAPQTETGDQ